MVKIGITQGDHNGVGLEVALKALSDATILELMTPVLYADRRLVEKAVKTFNLDMPKIQTIADAEEVDDWVINLIDLALDDITVTAGTPDAVSGRGAVASLRAATSDLKAGKLDAMVTAPISKEAAQGSDFNYSGHTEYLGAEAGDEYRPQMVLFDDALRVALVTTHLPIAEVPAAITEQKIITAITDFSTALREDFNIVRPKIAVLSLNPHCGDGGLLGKEETEVISPAIENCNEAGILAFGPFAADGFFGSGHYRQFDGILAMYHDQGLAPFKTLAAEHGVNYTAGLPFVRTSPDHGTACDIAWQGVADAASMREAIYKAIDISRNRANYRASAANPLRHENVSRPDKGERLPKAPKAQQENTETLNSEA